MIHVQHRTFTLLPLLSVGDHLAHCTKYGKLECEPADNKGRKPRALGSYRGP